MRILAVDDDPIILELLGQFFETMDEHELSTAESVIDALELIASVDEPFECFLLDIQMPFTDGVELCRILRDMDLYASTPILMLTAMSEKAYIDKAFEAGATDYITKPFELNSLKGRVGLVERIAAEQRLRTSKIFAANAVRENAARDQLNEEGIELHHPISVIDVEGVIENHAMENYVTQLSRKSLCGSVVIGFTIREVVNLHARLSAYDFSCVITDVAEAISDCLLPTQRLVSYAGNGTFVCVVEGAAEINLDRLVDQINRHIAAMELCSSNGTELNIRICAGQSSRLVWRKGDAALDALRDAHVSAENKSFQLAQDYGSIWTTARSA